MQRDFKNFISLIILGLILISCSKTTEPLPPDQDAQLRAFINVNLVPMTSEKVLLNQTVLIEGEKINLIDPSDEVDIPEDAIVIDGEGAYLMPGLADMHMHTKEDWLSDEWPVIPLNLYLANGVTTIRDFGPRGNDLTYVLRWQDEISEGTRIGPTIYTSGLRPGHPSAGSQDPQSIVQGNFAQGFDFLKIYSYLSMDDYHAVMTTAKQLGMYTAGHIPYPVGFDGIVVEGMDEIAHIEELDWEFVEFNRDTVLTREEWLPYLITSVLQQNDISAGFDRGTIQAEYGETLSNIISNSQAGNIPFCITLIVSELIVEKLFEPAAFLSRPELIYLPQAYLEAFNQGAEKHQMQFQGIEDLGPFKYGLDLMLADELHRGGIRLLLSTDSGTGSMGIVPGFSIHDELRILIENGFTPYEAIATGTINAASVVEAMTGDGNFGVIEPGKRADLILVNGNPLNDVANIKNPLGVMAAGNWYTKEALDQMITID
jgi:imidazolonepropionase-like amidohydrolase